MHYRASNRQYLTEKPATQKTTTSAQAFENQKIAAMNSVLTDYFNYTINIDSPTDSKASIRIFPSNDFVTNFVTVGKKTDTDYFCKTGWITGSNPFEDIVLKYDPNGLAVHKNEGGKKIKDIAQSIVTTLCNKLTQPAATQKTTTTTPTTTTPSNEPKKLTKPSGQADNDIGYYLFDTDLDFDRSKQGDEVVTVSTICNGPDKTTNKDFLMKAGENEYSINCRTAKYSCKFKKWSTSSEPTVPSSRWVSDGGGFGRMVVALAKKGGYNMYSFDDIGKTPDEIANKHAEYFCTNLKWQ